MPSGPQLYKNRAELNGRRFSTLSAARFKTVVIARRDRKIDELAVQANASPAWQELRRQIIAERESEGEYDWHVFNWCRDSAALNETLADVNGQHYGRPEYRIVRVSSEPAKR